MIEQPDDREDIERRLAQARRMINRALDRLTRERLLSWVRELEEQLRKLQR